MTSKPLHRPDPQRRASLRFMTFALGAAAVAGLSACSPEAEPPPPASLSAADAYDLLAKEARGFTVGTLVSNHTVYVLFDPQCPHCGHLWMASRPLLKRAKFVWIPVSILNATSTPQGAALLTAADPMEAMNTHETSILAGAGGISASSSIPDDIDAAIKKNTELLNRLGASSVPYLVGKNAASGSVVVNAGSMETAALSQLLGLS